MLIKEVLGDKKLINTEIELNGWLYKIRVPPIVCRHGPGYSGTNMRYLAISIPQVR